MLSKLFVPIIVYHIACVGMSEMFGSEDMKGGNHLKVFVGNVPFKVKNEELQEVFQQCGRITGINIRSDRSTGRSKGFGFITYEEERSALLAIQHLNGTMFQGRPLTVKAADSRGGEKTEKGVKMKTNQDWTKWAGPT